MKTILLTISLIICFLLSCKTTKHTKSAHSSAIENDITIFNNAKLTYQNDIKPIFDKSCNSCHNSKKIAGGYDFTNKDRIIQCVKDNFLLGVIKWEDGFMKMPMRAPKLDSMSIFKIENWVKNGMQL